MTTEKHDPWALLREARNWVGGWSGILPMAGKDIDALRARIDAALAALHEARASFSATTPDASAPGSTPAPRDPSL
jgi:hypothetical protein